MSEKTRTLLASAIVAISIAVAFWVFAVMFCSPYETSQTVYWSSLAWFLVGALCVSIIQPNSKWKWALFVDAPIIALVAFLLSANLDSRFLVVIVLPLVVVLFVEYLLIRAIGTWQS